MKLLNLLKEEKDKALPIIKKIEEQIICNKEFQNLTSEQKKEITKVTTQAKEAIFNADKPGYVLLRLKRYCEEEKRNQLEKIASMSKTLSGKNYVSDSIKVISASSLGIDCNLSQITNINDLEEWLESLRNAAQSELDKGNRISL